MASLKNTVITLPGQSLVDAQGVAWSIVGGQVAVNGVPDPTTGGVTEMAYENGLMWQKNASNLWWSKSGPTAAWDPPYGTTVNPVRGVVASADDTVARTAAHSITDATGNIWSIFGGQVALNGVADPTTSGVRELAYEKGQIWQENASGLWWGKTLPSDAWGPNYGTAASPVLANSTNTWVANNPATNFSDQFFDGENWSGGVAPGGGATAVIRDGYATFTVPQRVGALGEGGLTLYLGATDPTKPAGLTMTTNVDFASTMTLMTGAASGAANYAASIFAVSSTVSNEGHMMVAGADGAADLDIRLRYGKFSNFGTVHETGAGGTLKIWGTTQYGNSGSILNNGTMTATGGLIDLENPVSGIGGIHIDGQGTVKIGNAFATGETIAITAGTLEFGVVVPGIPSAWSTNPGMQFQSAVSFAGASDPAFATSGEQIKFDGAWTSALGDQVVLSNFQPGHAEMTVFENNVKIFDATIVGHYAQNEFSLGHSGADAFVSFTAQPLTAGVAHS